MLEHPKIIRLESSDESVLHKQRERLCWVSGRANLMYGGESEKAPWRKWYLR